MIIIAKVKEEATNWCTIERNLSFVWSDKFCALNSLLNGKAFALFQEKETYLAKYSFSKVELVGYAELLQFFEGGSRRSRQLDFASPVSFAQN
jgi:hypothetical protein